MHLHIKIESYYMAFQLIYIVLKSICKLYYDKCKPIYQFHSFYFLIWANWAQTILNRPNCISYFIEDIHMGLISYSSRNENEKIVCANKVSNRLLSFQIYQRKHLYVLIRAALDGIRSWEDLKVLKHAMEINCMAIH